MTERLRQTGSARGAAEAGSVGVDTKRAITETEDAVYYLGVRLEKAEKRDSSLVPQREKYADFTEDRELVLPLERDVAVSFAQGEPMLIEGGTSLGKTTTIRKMCAELGYEVHYVNLNGATDVEDLMGRYIPNPNKKGADDKEYIFADGKVTSGLRQEEGKIKVIILDEFNAAAPNIAIRLHEVIDALERDGDVVLSEDASESVPVKRSRTKVVALMNPPGKGYFAREPLDPAQLRRWVYKKLPSELPEGTFGFSTDVLFGITTERQQDVPAELYLHSRNTALTAEQLKEIPGIGEILEKYKEFHKAAKELLKRRMLAADQPQTFTYDDRMEPRRVRDFVLQFYNGDINQTFQRALEYYYVNKLENDEDRKKLRELMKLVECKVEPAVSKRKGAERAAPRPAAPEPIPPRPVATERSGERITLERAIESLGRDNVHGPEDVAILLGFAPKDVPPIPYTVADLEKSKEIKTKTGVEEMLVLFVKDKAGNPLTGDKLNGLVQKKYEEMGLGKFLYNNDWYKDEKFYKELGLNVEWKLVTKACLPDSYDKLHHFEAGDSYEHEDTQEYAIEQFALKVGIPREELKRPEPFAMIYTMALHLASTEKLKGKGKGERLLETKYHWSDVSASDGVFVSVGNADSEGVGVGRFSRVHSLGRLGVCLSR